MLKRLMVLGGMLAMLLVVAAPALAQTETEETIAGVIEPIANPAAEGPTHIVVEDVTGDEYGLISDAQVVDLTQYEGQFGYVTGTFQTQGASLSDFDDPTEVPIYVTAVEILDEGPYETEYAEVTGVISANPEVKVPGGEIPSHLITEDATGAVFMLHSGDVDLTQYEGQRATIYGPFQTLGGPLPPDPTEVPIYVTSLEVLDYGTPSKGSNDQPAEDLNIEITGVLQEKDLRPPHPTWSITHGLAGIEWTLVGGDVDLSQYVGQRVKIQGIFQTAGNPLPADPTVVPIYVTSLEVLDDATPSDEPDAIITGVIQPTANPEQEGSTHTITEDATGNVYGLFSNLQDDGVDLSQYVGQRITITGYFQTQGGPISDFPDPTEVLIYVESVEVLDSAPATDDQYQDESTVVEEPSVEDVATEDVATEDVATEDGVLSVLPDTGGLSLVTLGLVALLLLGGGGLLTYNFMRR